MKPPGTGSACLRLLLGAAFAAPTMFAGASALAEGGGEQQPSYMSEMRQLVDESPLMEGVNARESAYYEIERDLLSAWSAAWAGGSPALSGLSVPGAELPTWADGLVERRTVDGVVEFEWTPALTEASAELETALLASYSRIDWVKVVGTRIALEDARATVALSLDVRGESSDGRLRTDRGSLELTAQRTDDGWRILRLSPTSLERLELVEGRAPSFSRQTAAYGLSDVPVTDRREAIRRGGYALSAADFDGDGLVDLVVGHYGPVQLLRNTGDGFEDVTLAAGIAADELVKSAAVIDLDGDGHRDLLFLRFVMNSEDSVGDIVAYRNRGDGTFEAKGHVLPHGATYDRAMPLALADFDGNGFVDIYVGFPGLADFTNNLDAGGRPDHVLSQGIWMNQGNWTFEEVESGATIPADNFAYPHAALATDINGDGWPDLLVVDDSWGANQVYVNDAGRGFTNVTSQAGMLASNGWSMGISTADFNENGHVDVIATQVTFNTGRRIVDSMPVGELGADYEQMLSELRTSLVDGAVLYENRGDGTFVINNASGLTNFGDGAGVAEWVDFNGDGLLDVYVPNGLWTAGADSSMESYFFRSHLVRLESNSEDELDEYTFVPRSEPNPFLADLRSMPDLSIGGHERNRLYRNNGDGTFTEVGFLEGADGVEDGYIVATVDFNGNGMQDLVLRHTDPSPSVHYESVTVFRNDRTDARSMTVAARSISDIDAIGAVVTARIGDRTLIREIRATNGAVQAEPVAYFGLGTLEGVDELTIRWPTGEVESFGPQPAGRVVVRQGGTATSVAVR